MTTDASGNITAISNPYTRRTPWFNQTDFQFAHDIKVNKNNEAQVLGFEINVLNLFNQHSITSYYEGMNSIYQGTGLFQYGIFNGAASYQQFEGGYNVMANISGVAKNGMYGQPISYQMARSIRLQLRYTF
jgi:hypothetical protein